MFSPLSIKQEIGFVPQNRLRFGERAFAVDRLELLPRRGLFVDS
jgi:hypothetical protein